MHQLTVGRLGLRLGLVAAVVAGLTVTAVSKANAADPAQAYLSGAAATFIDKPGVSNVNLVVRTVGGAVQFDAQYLVVPGTGCSYPVPADHTKVACSGPITSAMIWAGDGNDTVDVDLAAPFDTVTDDIMGEGGDDTLLGGRFNSGLHGGTGDDTLSGRGGSDGLLGDEGADTMLGGPGFDTVDYLGAAHPAGVHISLDGVSGDDGMPGEKDTIGSDVEAVVGTRYDDVIIANAADNNILGCGGADQIYGLAGNDYIDDNDGYSCGSPTGSALLPDIIDGGTGTDTATFERHTAGVVIDLDGAYGDDGAPGEGDSVIGVENIWGTEFTDVITGDAQANIILGNNGDDYIYGLGGPDSLYGQDGADKLYGGDGADLLDGGNGTDICDLGLDGSTAVNC